MSTSVISRKKHRNTAEKALRKTTFSYLVLSIAAVASDQIYAIFGHEARSDYMSLMFLYPLLGGVAVYFLIGLLFSKRVAPGGIFRLGSNLYNSGLAALTVGSFYKGILEIAGTASDFEGIFMIGGGVLAAAGFVAIAAAIAKGRGARSRPAENNDKGI